MNKVYWFSNSGFAFSCMDSNHLACLLLALLHVFISNNKANDTTHHPPQYRPYSSLNLNLMTPPCLINYQFNN